jgi:polyphenol oxidase
MPSTPPSPFSLPQNAADPLRPAGWRSIEGLVCGFGDRVRSAPSGTLLLAKQVHGNLVVDAGDRDPVAESASAGGYPRVAVEADGLIAARPAVVVGVRTADCVPLLLVAPGGRWAAAVHAGWRGTIAGIAGEAVKAARRSGVAADGLLAALGPSIGPCCYEVSPELGEEFRRKGLPVVEATAGHPRPHLDLRAANRVVLERSGLSPANMEDVGPCTRCASELFHSFRADPGSAGRQISWIGWEDRRPSRGRAPHR